MITEGMHPVPAGHVAAVVTYLQMTAPAMTAPKPFPDGVTAARDRMDNDSYRALFRAVGAPWLWTLRLVMDDQELAAILTDDKTETWVIRKAGVPIGLVELDFRPEGACELAYFGMIKEATGQGLGGPMMALAQAQAFGRDIDRFFVHTCSWDDPRAMGFYQKAGFSPYQTAVEVFPDPRLGGPYSPDTAPHVPCLT
jgi:RimJ/RimL family protein N-acetyltransferase